jgi:hypothetical protein
VPVELSVATTMFGMVWPATQFKSDASGLAFGYTVKKLGAVVFVTVVLKITAVAPLAGTPAKPLTW